MFVQKVKQCIYGLLVMGLLKSNFAMAELTAKDEWFPNFVEVQIVSTGLNANGINMQLWQIKSTKTTAELLAYYRELWGKKAAFLRYDTTQWQLAGFVEKQYFVSVQLLKEQVDSFGYLSISEYPYKQPTSPSNALLQLPVGSLVSTNISATDGPHVSNTMVFKNKHSIASNVSFFRERFSSKGWAEDVMPSSNKQNTTLSFRKGADNATISISDMGAESGGIIVLVEH